MGQWHRGLCVVEPAVHGAAVAILWNQQCKRYEGSRQRYPFCVGQPVHFHKRCVAWFAHFQKQ